MRIFISGVHSGPNPSPGTGTARSIRQAFPDAELVAVDYSNRSSGLHFNVFNDVFLQMPWNQLDLALYERQIDQLLLGGAFWVSGLDLEVYWLAQQERLSTNILIPPYEKLLLTSKPAIIAHSKMPFSIAPYILISESDWALHGFCRRHGWKLWLKGPYYEARKVRSWIEFERLRSSLSAMWSTQNLFLQAHVTGYEESIAFCAYQGELLGSVHMTKRDITSEGKTWAGRISQADSKITTQLATVVADLNWTGGAELEFVKDGNQQRWLIDWNARFPAWIHGATIAGVNLPARLISRASNRHFPELKSESQEFTRIVIEIPTRQDLPLPSLTESSEDTFGWASKHPSGMPLLAKRFNEEAKESLVSRKRAFPLPDNIKEELLSLNSNSIQTPHYFTCERSARTYFEKVQNLAVNATNETGIEVNIAYSIKTNPIEFFVKTALETGMLSEAISQLEVKRAIETGFSPNQIILNGPAKFWPINEKVSSLPLRAIFCDSLEELESLYSNHNPTNLVGIRLKPIAVDSRFGISVDTPKKYRELLEVINKHGQAELGVHFHYASSVLGVESWWTLFDSMIEWAYHIEHGVRPRISCLDIGGGWFHDDWEELFLPRLNGLLLKAKEKLPNLKEVIIEPGKALVQPFVILIVKILEVRRITDDRKDIIVDGAISNVPDITSYPHRVLVRKQSGEWQGVNGGNDRVLGRICMESDILLNNISFSDEIDIGDYLAICDVGAYDRSMAYEFGKG